MRPKAINVFKALLMCLATTSCGAEPIRPQHAIRLFEAANRAGWHTWLVDTRREDPRRVFAVTEEGIHISGDGLGYIGTTDAFRDYDLSLEFRWGTNNTHWGDRIGKAQDSGVFVHGTGPDGNSHDGNGAFMAAIECNIFQGATGDFLLIRGDDKDGQIIAPRITAEVAATRDKDGWPTWDPGGKSESLRRWGRLNWRHKAAHWEDRLNFRGARDVEKAYGEWNRLQIACRGDRISVTLNGTLVNEAFSVWPDSGRILLQCEGSEIFYRGVKIEPARPEESDSSSEKQNPPVIQK